MVNNNPTYITAAERAEDQLVESGLCGYSQCDTTSVDHAVSRQVDAPGGLCKFHTLQAALDSRRKSWPGGTAPTEYRDAEPYIKWVRSAMESGTITYRGLTVYNVDKNVLAALAGISVGTVAVLRQGVYPRVKFRTAHALDPYVTLTTTEPDSTIKVGDRVDRAGLYRLPKGATVMDRYLRAWQSRDGGTRHRAPVWYPAHGLTPEDSPATDANYPSLDNGPRLPATVVWLPPRPLKGLHP